MDLLSRILIRVHVRKKNLFELLIYLLKNLGGCKIEGDSDKWDFGEGAGYYIDATESKWSKNYRMFSYVNDEFYELIGKNFNVDPNRIGIFG